MARTIAQYFTMDTTVGFLAAKQDYLPIRVWRIAFYTHVFSSIFTLLAGGVQFSSYILSRHRRIHRWIGRLYVADVLLVNVPAGLVMGIYANGLLPSKIAFLILDSLWFWFTLKAYLSARKRNFVAHRRYMIRSYALTFSAVTLRTWKLILVHSLTIDPTTLYMIDAWLGFVPNLLFAEWLLRGEKKGKVKKANRKKRIETKKKKEKGRKIMKYKEVASHLLPCVGKTRIMLSNISNK